MTSRQGIVLTIFALAALTYGCTGYRQANDVAVEKLRQQLIAEDFDGIYKETSSVTQAQLRCDEFVARVREVTDEMKSIDPNLNWVRSSHTPDEAVFRDDNFSWMHLEKDGRQLDVQVDWDPGFKLYAMFTFSEINDSGKQIFRNCD